MLFVHIFMIIAGLVMVGLGFGAMHFRSGMTRKLGALLAPLGLLMALTGTLLLCVPHFFSFE